MEADRASRRNRIAVAATLAAAAVLLGVQLLAPPIVGLADNGDFERLLHPAGLEYESVRFEDRHYNWMQSRFLWTTPSPNSSGYRTSEIFAVQAAVRINRLFGAPFFDTRVLAAIHALLLLLGFGLLVAACRDLATPAQTAAAALLVFFFTDVGYIGPFNSLYSQTASLVYLLITAGIAAIAVRRGRLSGLLLGAYFLSAALYICSKPQEVVQAPLLALLGLRLAWPGASMRRRIACAVLGALLCALAVRYYRSAEGSIGWVTRYNVIFRTILPDSPDAAADLAEMGMDPSLAQYSGMSAWMPGTPASDPAFREKLKAASPRAFLLRHPRRFLPLIREALAAAFILAPPDLGNFAKESARPALAKAFGPWGQIRKRLGNRMLLVLVPVGILAAALTWKRASPRGRLVRESLAALVAMTALAFATAIAGDTRVELERHLYTFQALWDLVLVAGVTWLISAVAVRRAAARRGSAATLPVPATKPRPRPDIVLIAAVGVAALILAAQLFVPPIIGLANNGDFEKVMGYAGFNYGAETREEKYFAWIVSKFQLMPPGWYPSGYRTSEIFLAGIARIAVAPFSRDGIFDLRVLGAVHVFIFLVGLGLLVAATLGLSPPTRWIAAGLLVFFFTDVGYAAPFNSFYSQTASLIFVLLTLGIAALAARKGKLQGNLLLAYFACAALFVCSKPQEPIHAPLLAALGWTLAAEPGRAWWRRPASWMAIGLCVLSLAYYRGIPKGGIRNVGLFHTVFTDLLPNSPDPAADLAELGLDADLLRYKGTNAYQDGNPLGDPDFDARFFQRFDFASLLRFYLRHPVRLADRLGRGAPLAFRLRPWRLGNYTKDSGHPGNAMTTHFALWSDARLRLGRIAVPVLLLFFGVNAALVFIGGRLRHAPMPQLARVTLGIVLVMAAVEYLVCALADYLGDFSRHLYVFQALFDLILIADVGWITQALVHRRSESEVVARQARDPSLRSG